MRGVGSPEGDPRLNRAPCRRSRELGARDFELSRQPRRGVPPCEVLVAKLTLIPSVSPVARAAILRESGQTTSVECSCPSGESLRSTRRPTSTCRKPDAPRTRISWNSEWDRNLGLGREKIYEVRRPHCDATFLDEYLTQDFCERQGLFVSKKNARTRPVIEVLENLTRIWKKPVRLGHDGDKPIHDDLEQAALRSKSR